MENGRLEDAFPIDNGDFSLRFVSLPEGRGFKRDDIEDDDFFDYI